MTTTYSNKRPKTTKEFVELAQQTHGNHYDYQQTQYVSAKKKVFVVCMIHQLQFDILPNNHLKRDGGCKKCQSRKTSQRNCRTFNEFVKKAEKKHEKKYQYRQPYINGRIKIEIFCSKHSSFFQTPTAHLQGQGCPQCKYEKLAKRDGWYYSESYFGRHPELKQIEGTFYIVHFQSADESFLKIGITKHPLSIRFSGYTKQLGYKIIPILEHRIQLYDAFRLEKMIKRELKNQIYKPTQKFFGSGECYLLESQNLIKGYLENVGNLFLPRDNS